MVKRELKWRADWVSTLLEVKTTRMLKLRVGLK